MNAGAFPAPKEQSAIFDIAVTYSTLLPKKTYVATYYRTGHIYDTKYKTRVYGLHIGSGREERVWEDWLPFDGQDHVPRTAQLRADDGTLMSGWFEPEDFPLLNDRTREARRITSSFLALCDLLLPGWAK